jgi:tetrahydromethanopterin S-methyltransferase subunit F
VLCERQAQLEIKDQIRREGKVKLSKAPQREIIALASARLVEDVEYRARLIAEAKSKADR